MNLPFTKLLLACAVVTVTLPGGLARAEPLLTGLGGPAGFGDGNLPGNDDGSTGEIDIRAAFPSGLRFFGMTFTSVFVNNNGNITFGGSLGTYTPAAFPIASQRMIAPWWGDVDTRGGGVPERNGVYWSITPGRFVATWHDVGYYSHHDDLQNDFQLILTAAGPGVGDFDVELRYNRCEWTTGDASGGSGGFGGTPAQAGFDGGNLRDFVALPGSLTMDVLLLCVTSNVEIAGVWRFAIRDGEVGCPGFGTPCETGMVGACAAGINHCASATETVCRASASPTDDLCNGRDDDCDGATDEALPATTCGLGACQITIASCVDGTVTTCVPPPPTPESCNTIDDDCNGVADDLPLLTCGIGACQVITEACVSGEPGVCTPNTGSPETCNGEDDDCNGEVDDTLDACMFVRDAGPPCRACRVNGRAGPGCSCRAGERTQSPGAAVLLVFLALTLKHRRRR
jgi:MYXO-CTERM domain-containing protein